MVPTRSNRYWALRICLIGFVLFVAWWVNRPKPITDWVTVRADAHAVFERPFHMHVEVAPTGVASQILAIGLHWATSRQEPRGFLSGSPPQQVAAQGGAYDFQFSLPDRDDLGYIFAVLYTGPSELWDERTRAAFTDSSR